jgi:hypothetical protein
MDLALLRCASWLVPRRQRREWAAEWRSELWYVCQSCGSNASDYNEKTQTPIAFCLGAFQDALWLRRNTPRLPRRLSIRFESARHCALFLVFLASVSLIAALLLPGARSAVRGRPPLNADGVVLIASDAVLDPSSPTIPLEVYEAWTRRRQTLFSDFAFYKPIGAKDLAQINSGLAVALASSNLFDLLNIPLSPTAVGEARADHRPALALTEHAWRTRFNADASLVGQVVEVAGQRAVVAAILPDGSWQLPSTVDAWLLEENDALETLPPASVGVVLGRIAATAPTAETRGHWHFSVSGMDGTDDGFNCAPVQERVEQPNVTFLVALLLALLALPATTPLPLGEYPATDASLTRQTRYRRWLFLLMKIGCTLPIVYFGSIALAFSNPSMRPASSECIQFATSFLALLFSFRWALRDQRRRCPVCLRRLTNPARVGHPSRNFLAWHGTEFICDQGHGLLHVPEMATTWFSTQRWLSLDPSWKGLFPEPCLPSAGLF